MTRLDLDGVGYTEAFQVLRDANQYAATHHTRLTAELTGTGAMAGDSSFAASWATSYDRTAGLVVTGFEDVVTALASVSRLCASSLDNHARAELASAALDPGEWPGLLSEHPYEVTAFSPPTSLGGDPSSLPGWANAILDHVEGFVWPDADLDRLHEAATTWTTLADHLVDLADLVARAGEGLWGERSPEIPLAIDALARLRAAITDLGVEAGYLAQACTDHAAAVQSHRDAVLDLVHDLLRDAIVIQAAGFALGLVTAGTANLGAASINVAKVAAEAPRFIALMDRLRDLAYTASLGLNAGATTVTSLRTRLGPFVRARLAIRGELGAARVPGVGGSSFLARHEGGRMGAHTLRDHVGKSDDFLRERLINEPGKKVVSTFTDEATAEAAITSVLKNRSDDIMVWMRDPTSSRKRFAMDLPAEIGRMLLRTGALVPSSTARVVLIKDKSMPEGFRILTSYPTF